MMIGNKTSPKSGMKQQLKKLLIITLNNIERKMMTQRAQSHIVSIISILLNFCVESGKSAVSKASLRS
jgi:hypothetical protein